jgi:cystathionine gamma-lyase
MSPSVAYYEHPYTNANGVPKLHLEGFGTRAIHVGSEPNRETGAVIPSISLATTYKQDAVGNNRVSFSYASCVRQAVDDVQGFEYSRSGNPNRNDLESMLASLESGGSYALAFSSGSAATATIINALGPDSHILSVNDVYGGTYRYMTRVAAANQGVQVTFLDLEKKEDDEILAAFQPNTKVNEPIPLKSLILTPYYIVNLDRIAHQSYSATCRHITHCPSRTVASFTPARSRRQHLSLSILFIAYFARG